MTPAFFIGHGSPMNALGGNSYSAYLQRLGQEFKRPRAILAISAHWETEGTQVLDLEQPPTIHDFGGFPPELYQIKYPAPGATALASQVASLTGAVRVKDWGLDHGTWAVLRHLFPEAEVPVTQLSLNRKLDLEGHYRLGRELRALRDDGILILGSGNIVHNLRDFSRNENGEIFAWAAEFDQTIKAALERRDLRVLLHFEGVDPALVKRCIPTPEHYLPLAYLLGASDESESARFLFDEIQNGSIAMRSIQFGPHGPK